MSYRAKIFTREELVQAIDSYLVAITSGTPKVGTLNAGNLTDFIYEHYGTETEVEE